ncbi:MAG TPA: tRNA pseudouridine(38-40) synthase TruA [Chitinophagaceae bacterium]|nr:tRNA pseudouridine(38-40) synthase TruA [Chitinophagaceae bacterium]
MPRYFLEVAYKGTNYSGFQSQHNANTIQAEIEKAFTILQKEKVILTGSSRTDTGVHALQNFFHFDFDRLLNSDFAYKMNAILPGDIVVKQIIPVAEDAHCRFDALSREYKYYIYRYKDPFLKDIAFYYPYKLDIEILYQAAAIIKEYEDFTSFSKRNTQVKSFKCEMQESKWYWEKDCLVYHVKANRFLRGMVRALTATMLKIGRGQMSLNQFREIIEAKDCTRASFAVPPQGLFLVSVAYPPTF